MAFIREYADAGDPFSLRRPKRWRKWKPGKSLQRLGGSILRALPVVSQATEFARGYGFDLGDPGKPPKAQKRRKSAGAGPKHKAEKKAQRRHEKAASHAAGAAPRRKGKKGGGVDWASVARAAGGFIEAAPPIVGQFVPTGIAEELQQTGMPPGIAGKFGRMPGMGHRRAMNPSNVKALRRSLRRLEGFEKLVKRIEKAYPRMRHHGGGGVRATRGHRAGCRCAVCKRAA